MKIKLTNTITKKKELFIPIVDKKVGMYVCGITPYDLSHLGHGRCYVSFDILYRLLLSLGYDVTYIRNYTDIDDKILKKAELSGNINNYKQISNEFIDLFKEDMKKLNCLPPTNEPKVTEHIDQIIEFIKQLEKEKIAYAVDNDVYFDVSKFKEYGKLSGKNIEDLKAGARVEINIKKKHPADFALWKGNKEKQFWKSPWGYGRPGWHIECSVLANEYLGDTMDIHGGGADLIFPHHENEIAQSEGLHKKPFANYWLHNAHLNINKEKMSKSLNNFFTLKEIFEKEDPMVLRFYFLQHQYKTPMEFSFDDLNSAKTAYKKLVSAFSKVKTESKNNLVKKITESDGFNLKILEAICDDMNTPKAFGIVFENLKNIKENPEDAKITKTIFSELFGLTLQPIEEEKTEETPEITKLLEQREQARENKDWKLADEIRNQLNEMGVDVQDKKL